MKRKAIHITASGDSNKVGTLTAELKNDTALIRVKGYIGSEKNNADLLSVIVDGFLEKGIKKAIAFVSSQGGSVFEANDMVAELNRFDEVKVQIGAVCASAATRFATAFLTEARPNSQIMMHKPSLFASGTEDEVESSLKMLKDVTKEYRDAYAKKMGKTEDEINKMWANGDKWFTAKEAREAKLIDSISTTPETIDADAAAMLTACGAPVKHKPTATPTPTKPYMEKEQLIASLGLAADATDEQIKTAIEAMKKKADAADAAQKDEKTAAEKKAEKAVLAGITAKKIPASQKEIYITAYMKDPEVTQEAIDALPVIAPLSSELDRKKTADVEAARKDWTLETYLEKDPEAYERMRKDDPEKAGRLEAEYFGGK